VKPIRTFGRVRSRTVKPAQAARMESLLPRLAIAPGAFDPTTVGPFAETWLEIGFGGGEHLAAQAAARPDVLLLGAEPFVNGVASLVRHVDAKGLANVRIWPADGRELMAALPDRSLTRLFVLFPDPWPKARHRKRRLVDAAFAAEVARLLKPGGELRFATDWTDYAHQALEVLSASPNLAWTAERADDWRAAPAGHVPTRYQAKSLGDTAPVWLQFERR
jgi:tRNA (guanine-N7-)-methyltransferase